jgi:hypothetical protein
MAVPKTAAQGFVQDAAGGDLGMNDATAFFFWIVATAIVGGSAFLMARSWFPHDGVAATTLHVITLSWACVVGVTLLLGIQGLLTSPLLMLGTIVTAICGAWCVCGDRGEFLVGRNKSSQFRHCRSATPPPELRNALFRPTGTARSTAVVFAVMWGIVAATLGARMIFHGLLRLPDDWDTLAYHLPLLTHWLNEQTLYAPDCAFGYVPGNNEILGLWAVAPFSGDFLISLNNILPAILLAAASFELCQLLGVIQPIAHLCSLCIVSTRPMFRQIISAENDLAVVALFLATLVYAIRFAKQQRLPAVCLAAMTFGLLAGIKYYAIGYAAVAGLGLLGLVWAMRGGKTASQAFEIGLVGVLLLGGYWYFRNAWHYGSPLFPKGMSDGSDLWDEMRPESHTSSLLYGGRIEVWKLLVRAIFAQAGPVALLATLLLPASIAWAIVSALKKERSSEAKITRLALVGVIVLAAVVYCITPNVIETKLGTMNMLISQYHPVRFGLPLLSIAIIGAALASSDLVRWLSVSRLPFKRFGTLAGAVVIGHWGIGAAWQFVEHASHAATLDEWLLAGNLCLSGAVVVLGWTSRSAVQRYGVSLLVASTLLFATWGTASLARRWHESFNAYYDQRMAGGSLETLATLDPTSERICVCDSRYYPFLGSRRQFDVCRPLWFPDAVTFLRYVADQNATIVVVCTSNNDASGRYTPIKSWLLEQPHLFHAFDENRRYTMFRVDRNALLDQLTRIEGPSTP